MKKGFTLVELMVVIVVIGVLSAIAIPQFGNAIARARAAEVPGNLKKIAIAQEAYRTETKKYKGTSGWGTSNETAGKNLGVKITLSKFFTYSTQSMDSGTRFNANANLVSKLGKAEPGVKVTLTETGRAYVRDGNAQSRNSLKLYLKTFLTE